MVKMWCRILLNLIYYLMDDTPPACISDSKVYCPDSIIQCVAIVN